jgi:hypothetical protein
MGNVIYLIDEDFKNMEHDLFAYTHLTKNERLYLLGRKEQDALSESEKERLVKRGLI